MISEQELTDAIREIESCTPSLNNCQKLASLYTVKEYLYPDGTKYQQSYDAPRNVIGYYGDSEFLNLIRNKDIEEFALLMDELMETIQLLNPRLYDSVIRKLN